MVNNRMKLLILLLLMIGAAGVYMMLKATPYGLGFYSDSEIYLQTSRNFSRGHGLTMSRIDGGFRREGFFPSGYALLLSVNRLFSLTALDWSRWLNAFFFGLNIILMGWITWKNTENIAISLGSAIVFSASWDVLEVHSMIWSEPAFVFFTMAGLLLVGLHLQKPSRSYLVGAGSLIAFCWLTRYAGVVWIAAGGLALLFLGNKTLKCRIIDALIFGAISTAPMVPWMVICREPNGSAAGRVFVMHARAFVAAIPTGVDTVMGWMVQDKEVPWSLSIKVLLLAVIVTVLIILTVSKMKAKARVVPFILMIWCVVICYSALLAVTIIFFDASTPLDARLLVPLHASVFLLLGPLVVDHRARYSGRVIPRIAALIVVFTGLWFVSRGLLWARNARCYGQGFANTSWKESGLLKEINRLKPSQQVYSNVPYPVIAYADRPCELLPTHVDINTRKVNNAFRDDISRLRSKLRRRQAVVAYFNNMEGNDDEVPPLSEFQSLLHLRLLKKTEDGGLYAAE